MEGGPCSGKPGDEIAFSPRLSDIFPKSVQHFLGHFPQTLAKPSTACDVELTRGQIRSALTLLCDLMTIVSISFM